MQPIGKLMQMAEVNYSKLAGIILPARTMGTFEAIKYCEHLKEVTGEAWMMAVTDGRLIYTREFLEESDNVDNNKEFRNSDF